MASYLDKREEMVASISNVLEKTGEFSNITLSKRFERIGDNADGILNQESKRNIYCVSKRGTNCDFQEKQILVHCHHDVISKELFLRQLITASKMGIYTATILYGYPNSTNEDSHGPLFKRFVISDSDKKNKESLPICLQDSILMEYLQIPKEIVSKYRKNFPGLPFYKLASAIKNAEPELDKLIGENWQRVNRFRILTELESDMAYAVSKGMPFYFRPKPINSNQIKEHIKRYKFKHVFRRVTDIEEGEYKKVASNIFEPECVDFFDFYTIVPFVAGEDTRKRLEDIIENNYDTEERKKLREIIKQYNGDILLAQPVALPALDANSDSQRLLRKRLGIISNYLTFGFYKKAENLLNNLEKTFMSTFNNSEIELMEQYHSLINLLREEIPKPKSRWHIKEIVLPSFSEPGKLYVIKTLIDSNTGKVEETNCNCKDFHYRVKTGKKKYCKHIQEVQE